MEIKGFEFIEKNEEAIKILEKLISKGVIIKKIDENSLKYSSETTALPIETKDHLPCEYPLEYVFEGKEFEVWVVDKIYKKVVDGKNICYKVTKGEYNFIVKCIGVETIEGLKTLEEYNNFKNYYNFDNDFYFIKNEGKILTKEQFKKFISLKKEDKNWDGTGLFSAWEADGFDGL